MNPHAFETLQKIGHQLDNDVYPAVHNGGFVMPCETGVSGAKGEEMKYERQRTRRSKTRPRDGTTRRQGPASEASSLICADLQTRYESELNAMYEAYPKTRVWKQQEGMLLLTESALLSGLEQPAIFLVAIPYAKHLFVRGWGFWGVSVVGIEWIGPRHTNFPDGSICAFEPSDGTWKSGDSLTQLLDFYSLWALRHLHMKVFDRWPGYQAVHTPYERILELRPEEHCGCEHSDRLYGECCQKNDKKRNIIADAINFTLKSHGGRRMPPPMVTDFVLNRTNPLNVADLF